MVRSAAWSDPSVEKVRQPSSPGTDHRMSRLLHNQPGTVRDVFRLVVQHVFLIHTRKPMLAHLAAYDQPETVYMRVIVDRIVAWLERTGQTPRWRKLWRYL